jgi:arylsulfatase A-like enzyme
VRAATTGPYDPEVVLRTSSDAETVADAEAFLFAPGHDRRFAWVHLMTLHGPHHVLAHDRPLPAAHPMSEGYVSEALRLDAILAPLLERIAASWSDDPIAVVLSADHAEAFGEHGFTGHTRSPYDEVLRVPLVLLHPEVAAGERPELASARDIPPTLLGAFGMMDEARAAERFGRSLFRIRGTPSGTPLHRFVLAESARAASGRLQLGPTGVLVTPEWKLVVGIHDMGLTLFDRVGDPGETTDVVEAHADVAETLYRRFATAQDLGAFPPR